MTQATTRALDETRSARPTSLYRYYDEWGLLIYVGITARGIARNVEHNTSKEWWGHVHRQEVEHFTSWDDAHAAEVNAIEKFTPPFNQQHNPDYASMRAAYEDVIKLDENLRDPLLLMEATGGALAAAFEPRPSRKHPDRAEMWFSPRHVAITSRLRLKRSPAAVLREGGHGEMIGQVRSMERTGPFVVARLSIRPPLNGPMLARAQVSELCVKGPLQFKLDRVRLAPLEP